MLSFTIMRSRLTQTSIATTYMPGHQHHVHCRALWHSTQGDLVVTIEEGALHSWSVSSQGASCTASQQAGELLQLWSGQLSPHDTSTCATAGGNNIQVPGSRCTAHVVACL